MDNTEPRTMTDSDIRDRVLAIRKEMEQETDPEKLGCLEARLKYWIGVQSRRLGTLPPKGTPPEKRS